MGMKENTRGIYDKYIKRIRAWKTITEETIVTAGPDGTIGFTCLRAVIRAWLL